MPVPLFPRNERPDSNTLVWLQVWSEEDYKTRWKVGGFDNSQGSWFVIGELHKDRQRIVSPTTMKIYIWEFAVGYWTWLKPADIPPEGEPNT